MLVIFLNNKLITCDTILPLMMELHRRTGRRCLFLTRDAETFDAIRENFVLWEAIRAIGRLVDIGRSQEGFVGFLRHRLRVGSLLLGVALRAVFGRVDIFHFRALNQGPLRLLYRVNRRRTYFCESDSFGEPPLMAAVGSAGLARRKVSVQPAAGRVVAFSPHFRWLASPELAGIPKHIFGPTRLRKTWLDYVRDRGERDWRAEFARAGVAAPDSAFVFFLGFFGYPGCIKKVDGLAIELFHETLDAILDVAPDVPVVLKPHVFTDMSVVEAALRARPRLVAVVSLLHPSILASRAKAAITNLYSTTQADAHALGVPTIEYTEYSDEALRLSGGGSMRPDMIDHFIQRDPTRLHGVLAELARRSRPSLPEGAADDPSGLLALFDSAQRGGAAVAAARAMEAQR